MKSSPPERRGMLDDIPLVALLAVVLVGNLALTWLIGRRMAGKRGNGAADAAVTGGAGGVECRDCGARNEPGYRFCRSCAAELSGGAGDDGDDPGGGPSGDVD
jgi:hypothetical protein